MKNRAAVSVTCDAKYEGACKRTVVSDYDFVFCILNELIFLYLYIIKKINQIKSRKTVAEWSESMT